MGRWKQGSEEKTSTLLALKSLETYFKDPSTMYTYKDKSEEDPVSAT